MSKIKSLSIDLAKTVFQLHGVDERGVAVLRKQVSRGQLLKRLAQIPPCTVAMEACASSHYWGRQISALGHKVVLIAPQHVKPYVMGNKTDRNDAEAICEAMGRPKMRFVPVKSAEQQSLLAAHRFRSLIVKSRTALVNHIRGELLEFGICLPKGIAKLRAALHDTCVLERLPSLMQQIAHQMQQELRQLDAALLEATRRIEHLAHEQPACRHLMRRSGIGVQIASALVAEIDPTQFKNGRHLSAFIGLVPREHSSGNKQVKLGITKRGNPMLRTLMIHGARSVVRMVHTRSDPLSQWVKELIARRGKHKAIVALANKMARYAWVDLMQARQLAFNS
jgi:transposase